MALPTLRQLGARRQKQKQDDASSASPSHGVAGPEADSERTLTPTTRHSGVNIKLATKTRRNWILLSSFFFFLSVIFLILTIIGNVSDKPVLRNTYFYSLDLTNIIPASAGDITLVNSLARSLGLHDFYQVGLWNFCEGYNDEGITSCSSPQSLFWFNPVEVLLDELLSGATIALPAEINTILRLIRIASHVMFGFYLTGICMNFISIFAAPIALYSRWWSLPFSIWTFIAALLTTAATIIATVMSVIFRNVATSQTDLNIGASIGNQMFAFMWIASAFSIFGWAVHAGMCCCCASRRDVQTGRKKGRASAYVSDGGQEKGKRAGLGQKFGGLSRFGKKKREGEVV